MTILFSRTAEQTAGSRRFEARACVSIAPLPADAVDACLQRTLAAAERLPADASLCIDASYHAPEERLEFTLTGDAAGMRLLDARGDDAAPVFDPEAYCRLTLRVAPVRYELRVALGDHLLAAAKNHPAGGPPLHVDAQYDEEDQRLDLQLTGSVFATSYLLFLTWLQLTQSRYR